MFVTCWGKNIFLALTEFMFCFFQVRNDSWELQDFPAWWKISVWPSNIARTLVWNGGTSGEMPCQNQKGHWIISRSKVEAYLYLCRSFHSWENLPWKSIIWEEDPHGGYTQRMAPPPVPRRRLKESSGKMMTTNEREEVSVLSLLFIITRRLGVNVYVLFALKTDNFLLRNMSFT